MGTGRRVRLARWDMRASLPLGPQITADLLSNGIDVYPQKEFDEDLEDRLVNEKFRVSVLARIWFPGAPRFLLEDMGRSSCPVRRASVFLSHENVFSGVGGVRAPVPTRGLSS